VEARAAAAANPQLDYVHIMLGATLSKLDRRDEALQELAQAIAIKPSPTAYLTRANIRPMSDLAGRRADIAAALKLDPTMMIARYMAISTELLAHNYAAAIEATNAGLTKQPGDAWLLAARGMAYGQTKRQPDADKDFVAARAAAGKNGPALNNLCWEKATRNLALTAALADCDASLQVMGDAPNTYDSRGFVLYRLGRFQDAIDNYDRALKLKSDLAPSLYMRGLAKRRLGKTADGDADVQAAKKLDPYVEKAFADYGVTG